MNKTNDVTANDSENDDADGQKTISYLTKCLKVVRRLNSIHPSSLGLHPAIYFYSKDGRHKPASFWAAIDFIQELEKRNKFDWFTDERAYFEKFLISHDYIIQQIVRRYRSAAAAYPYITQLYFTVVDLLHNKVSVDELPKKISANENFSFVTLNEDAIEDSLSKDFSREKKSEIFMKQALENAIKCRICNGLLHKNSITIDHIERKEDGGLGSVSNGQLSHPYCNSTYKN